MLALLQKYIDKACVLVSKNTVILNFLDPRNRVYMMTAQNQGLDNSRPQVVVPNYKQLFDD
jgi:hypothetical protein